MVIIRITLSTYVTIVDITRLTTIKAASYGENIHHSKRSAIYIYIYGNIKKDTIKIVRKRNAAFRKIKYILTENVLNQNIYMYIYSVGIL